MSVNPDHALHFVLDRLRAHGYRFTTPTPATHARVLARPDKQRARTLRDVFGWSLPFSGDVLPEDIAEAMVSANALEQHGELFASRVRVSTLGDDYFLHSAYPTTQQDAVFFGPDSYRFADFLRAELPRLSPRTHIVDIGTGAGVGAVTAARCWPEAYVTLTDINRAALRLAAVNWMANDFAFGGVMFKQGDKLSPVNDPERPIDCIIANPPYIADGAHRAYRDGGEMHGGEVSLAWARAAAARLECGGAFLLYTGSAIVDGEDRLRAALHEALAGFDISYRELDPDVFGEELERVDYADVERIAVVGLVAVKR
jgi:methylase of polypeptide subunit release factors